ncbi:MAG TPA: hypothetical protein VF185_01065 [Patescibacteria group bacterium]
MQDNTSPQNSTNTIAPSDPGTNPTFPTETPPETGAGGPADTNITTPPQTDFAPPSPRRRALIPTILGLVLLVVGVGAGLLLVQQQQIFKQKAAGGGAAPGASCVNPGEQSCIECNGAGTGVVCQANNTYGPCVRLDACGGASNNTPGGFAGCGDKFNANKCDNCFYNSDGTVNCVSQNSSCGCQSGCPAATSGQCSTSGYVPPSPTPTSSTAPAPTIQPGWGACGSCSCVEAGVGERGSECQRNPQGACVWNPSTCAGGSAPTPTPKPTCGQACTQTSDCAAAGNGGTVTCVAGICQNASCIGKTIPGRNCDCSSLNACGNPCSASLGLCQTGSVCRYIVGPSCTVGTGTNNTTYCVPDTLPTGWTTNNCVARDQGNSYVLNSSGANPTAAEVQQACGPTPTATCTGIQIYDTNWNPLTTTQLSALKPGDKIRFTLTGTTTSGVFDKARFTINGTLQPEVATKRPSSADFYEEYTIPTNITNFTVSGQLHHQVLNQWF